MREREIRRISVSPAHLWGKEYFVAKVGRVSHFKPAMLLYVHQSLVKQSETGLYVEFPAKAEIRRTAQKDIFILLPSEDMITYYIYVKPGFRGMGLINKVLPSTAKVIEVWDYESEQGSLGKGTIAFITVTKDISVMIEWERTGRLYGSPGRGITVYHPDGTVEELDNVYLDVLNEIDKVLGGE
jgi:hypothetical protein